MWYRIIFLFAVSFCALSVQAASLYQVEVVVFSRLNVAATDDENLTLLSEPPSFDNIPELSNRLPNSRFLLDAAASRLTRSGYSIVLHEAWTMPLLEAGQSRAFHIYGGTGFDSRGNAVTQNTTGNAPYSAAAYWQLNGNVRISVDHYWNVKCNWVFAAPRKQIARVLSNVQLPSTSSGLVFINLNETRRLRSQELNYIDHPLYGALLLIRRL